MLLLPVLLPALFLVLSFVLPVFDDMSVLARITLPIAAGLVAWATTRITSRDEDGAWWRSWW